MREVLQQELADVQQRLVRIAELVAEGIAKATTAFNQQDIALAESVIAGDRQIDELAATLDELAVDILARQQPVARYLRVIVTALRASASLDAQAHADHIAQLIRYRFPEKVVPKSLRSTFRELGALDVEIAKKLARLLDTEDPELADEIRNDDDAVDELHLGVLDHHVTDHRSPARRRQPPS